MATFNKKNNENEVLKYITVIKSEILTNNRYIHEISFVMWLIRNSLILRYSWAIRTTRWTMKKKFKHFKWHSCSGKSIYEDRTANEAVDREDCLFIQTSVEIPSRYLANCAQTVRNGWYIKRVTIMTILTVVPNEIMSWWY